MVVDVKFDQILKSDQNLSRERCGFFNKYNIRSEGVGLRINGIYFGD